MNRTPLTPESTVLCGKISATFTQMVEGVAASTMPEAHKQYIIELLTDQMETELETAAYIVGRQDNFMKVLELVGPQP